MKRHIINHSCFSAFLLTVLCFFAGAAKAQTEEANLVLRYHFQHFSQEEGLSQGFVTCMLRDRRGYLWVGTEEGLNRFDGYSFKVYDNNPLDEDSLSHGQINALLQDRQQNLWIGTRAGLNRMDAITGRITRIHFNASSAQPDSEEEIRCLQQDHLDRLWVGTDAGLILFDPADNSSQKLKWPGNQSNIVVMAPMGKRPKHFFVGNGSGLFDLDVEALKLTQIDAVEDADLKIRNNAVYGFTEQPLGTLWLGTEFGLVRYDYESQKIQRYRYIPGDPHSLSANQVLDICPDSADPSLLWLATPRGLNLFDRKTEQFAQFRHDPADRQSLGDDFVYKLLRDEVGALWIGTVGRGFDLVRPEATRFHHTVIKYPQEDRNKSNKIMSFLQAPNHTLWIGTLEAGLIRVDPDGKLELQPSRFSSPSIYALHLDQKGLWVGTQSGLAVMDPPSGKVLETFTSISGNPQSLSNNWVTCFQPDPADPDYLWVGTYEGLNRLNLADNTFQRFLSTVDASSLGANWIADLTVVPSDARHLWVGTFEGGLNRYDLETHSFKRYMNVSGQDTAGPGSNSVLCIQPDPHNPNILWLGTRGGLSRMDITAQTFQNYRVADGLPNNLIYGVLFDSGGDLWLSTNKGVSRFNPTQKRFRNYTALDGLQESEFNLGAYYKSAEGRLYFGGLNGFNSFFGDQIQDNTKPPTPVLSELFIANKLVHHKDPDSPLTRPIELADDLTLEPDQNMFSLRFAALHYANPKLNRFSYKLEGYDNTWLETDAQTRMATYTKIPPGSYTFHLKAANKDGYWSEAEALIKIKVLPPWWRTLWAYLLYVMTCLGIIGAFVRMQHNKLKAERISAANERRLNARLRQLDRLKDEFLANTSHELRTPLNGIIGLAESLVAGVTGQLNPATRENLSMIVSSARRLNNLVNDILDFSKLKNKTLELHLDAVVLFDLAEEVLALTRPLARQADLQLLNEIPRDLPMVYADAGRLEQILYNLIGNAIKFTDHGSVAISAYKQHNLVYVAITDTGIGIPAERLDSIFESFEQVDGGSERAQGGTGLGLAITRKVVELHGGKITVASTPGQGSTFTFTLKLADDAWQEPPMLVESEEPPAPEEPEDDLDLDLDDWSEPLPPAEPAQYQDPSFHLGASNDVYTLLVVDDEPVNRQVISNFLASPRCRLIEAQSGQEALKAIAAHPQIDLILLDIMMPRMSGLEVCRTLRKTHNMFDLPVIFLTAKTQPEDLEEGFRVGANDYMNKPINKGELLARVGTHLQLLDAHRHLEQRVRERTQDLAAKNQEITRSQKQLVMQEKLAFLGNFAAGMAHEIRNPLNIVKNLVLVNEELAREILGTIGMGDQLLNPENILDETEDLVNNAVVMKNHCERMDRIISQLLVFTREQKNEFRMEDINKFLETYVQLTCQGSAQQAHMNRIEIEFEADPTLTSLRIMPGELSRAIINVVTNAIESVVERHGRREEGYQGRILYSTLLSENRVALIFKDNGCGIAPENLTKIYEPFFTTRLKDKHIGLGLSIAKDIIEQGHEGSIEIRSEEDAYTEVIFWLPIKG